MMRSSIVRVAPALAVFVALALGCASTPDDAGSTETKQFGESFEEETVIIGSEREQVPELETVYFDFDMALVRNDQKPKLQTNGTQIQGHGEWRRVTLQGYTDERGSEEYNLALGERRANSVKRYLETLGVPGSRLDTVSFGEADPAVPGHDEAAWRWNRRVQFHVTR
ncbi:MAG: OmpA family protein [Myxococcota bacterium]